MANHRHLSVVPDYPIPVLLQEEAWIRTLKTNLPINHRIRLDSSLIADLCLAFLARRASTHETPP